MKRLILVTLLMLCSVAAIAAQRISFTFEGAVTDSMVTASPHAINTVVQDSSTNLLYVCKSSPCVAGARLDGSSYGPVSVKGDTGATGAQGPTGANGSNGSNGTNGEDGAGITAGTNGTYGLGMQCNSAAFTGYSSTGMYVFCNSSNQMAYRINGGAETVVGSGGGTWGSITGTLADQTDLQDALDAITAGGINITTAVPSTSGSANLNDSTHVLSIASTTGVTTFTGSFTAWDTTPTAFSFTDITDATVSTEYTSAAVQITGINYPAAVSTSSGTAAICTGTDIGTCGAFSSSPGNISVNQYARARVTSSPSNSTAVTAPVTIGGVSDTYSVTTVAGASCSETPAIDTTGASVAQTQYAGYSAANHYAGQKNFTVAANASICKLSFKLKSYGTITSKQYVARVWATTSDNLITLVASSDAVTGGEWSSGPVIDFTFPTPAQVSTGTTYALTVDSGEVSSSNYTDFYIVTGGTFLGTPSQWPSTGTYGTGYSNDAAMRVYYVQ